MNRLTKREKRLPTADESFFSQFFENARGRYDLKQPAGFLTLGALLYCAVMEKAVSNSLVATLGAVVLIWWIGDTTEAVTVIKALYGGFRTPETQINSKETSVESNQTTITPAADREA